MAQVAVAEDVLEGRHMTSLLLVQRDQSGALRRRRGRTFHDAKTSLVLSHLGSTSSSAAAAPSSARASKIVIWSKAMSMTGSGSFTTFARAAAESASAMAGV